MFAEIVPVFVVRTFSSNVVIPSVVFAPAIFVAEFIRMFPACDAAESVIVWALPGFVILNPSNIRELILAVDATVSETSFTFAFVAKVKAYSPENPAPLRSRRPFVFPRL
jgi:hypothetical protein